MSSACEEENFTSAISYLLRQGHIYQFDEFFTIRNDRRLLELRRNGNLMAKKLMRKAEFAAGVIYQFPFVKAVAVSGSLSKNYADDQSDIDFFIITARNRLWVSRTLLHLFKKISFLFNKQDLFCMNYFVDDERCEIEEKNYYTAVELATLIPLRGAASLHRFGQHNRWVTTFLPNKKMLLPTHRHDDDSFWKTSFHILFSNRFGDFLDDRLMNLTKRRWMRKEEAIARSDHGVRMGMHVSKHCSKPKPVYFQIPLLKKYASRCKDVFDSLENQPLEFASK